MPRHKLCKLRLEVKSEMLVMACRLRVTKGRWRVANESNYRTRVVCRVSRTLGKGPIALGIRFAESRTRQRALGKQRDGKAGFAECFLSGTRQRLCRVHFDTRQKNKREIKKNGLRHRRCCSHAGRRRRCSRCRRSSRRRSTRRPPRADAPRAALLAPAAAAARAAVAPCADVPHAALLAPAAATAAAVPRAGVARAAAGPPVVAAGARAGRGRRHRRHCSGRPRPPPPPPLFVALADAFAARAGHRRRWSSRRPLLPLLAPAAATARAGRCRHPSPRRRSPLQRGASEGGRRGAASLRRVEGERNGEEGVWVGREDKGGRWGEDKADGLK